MRAKNVPRPRKPLRLAKLPLRCALGAALPLTLVRADAAALALYGNDRGA
jgi:hypothetical protein